MQTWKRILIRSFGLGMGFALTLAILIGVVSWREHRPKQWSSKAVTAKIGELSFHQRGDDLHCDFEYALTNNTGEDYRLPLPPDGVLMRTIKENNSMANVDDFTWDNAIIPPHQTVSVTFDVAYHFADYGTSAEELYGPNNPKRDITNDFTAFVNRRLKAVPDGFMFLDYRDKYQIELPSTWQALAK